MPPRAAGNRPLLQGTRMKHRHTIRPHLAAPLTLGFSLLLASSAIAQVYRSVGPDGRVTFSDTPPAAQPAGPRAQAAAAASSDTTTLPYALRQTVQRYPVTLYTTTGCEPCASGRKLLSERGIPFTEKTVSSNADIAALQKLTGGDNLPALSIGQQQLKGFSAAEWTQYLSAAGYPSQSQLPARWNAPDPTALAPQVAKPAVAVATGAASAAQAAAAPAEPPVAPRPTATNPAGIRF